MAIGGCEVSYCFLQNLSLTYCTTIPPNKIGTMLKRKNKDTQ